jgi:predicted phage tail protein
MRKIILYGELAKRFGREHHFSVRSASEAVQAMCVNYPGFKTFLGTAHRNGIGFKVFVGHSQLKNAQESLYPSSDSEVIRLSPALLGSGAVARIIIGAALIVIGVVATPISVGFSNALTGVGISLVLGGVIELLSAPTKPPGFDDIGANDQSYIFSGPENVTQQGGPVPLGYGRMMVGSTVISASIEDEDQ